jgi:hypothetical protein
MRLVPWDGVAAPSPDRTTFCRLSVGPSATTVRLNQQFVDGILRRITRTAGVGPPQGAMAHALRLVYGMDLALSASPSR